MNRRRFVATMAAALAGGGCDIFGGEKKNRLPGDRISVLGLDRRIQPDPALANQPVALPPPTLNREWAEPGGNPAHSMGNPALAAQVKRVWQTGIGDGTARYTKVMSQPVIADGRVFAMDGGVQLSALDPATGKQFWQTDLKPDKQRGNAFGGGPCFWNKRLYVTTGYADVLAVNPDDGKIVWRQNVGSPIHAQPTVADNRIFVVTVDNELVALAAADGRRQWSHNGIPETTGLLGNASPAVEGEIVVVAYNSGELYALRVENGKAVWSENLASGRVSDAVSAMADIHGRPVIDRGRVFALSHSGRMTAIELRTGAHVWEQELGSSHQPWCAGDAVFLLANDNELVCLTRNEGKVRWASTLPEYENIEKKKDPITWAGPVLAGNQLIVLSSTGVAMFLSPQDGKLAWQTSFSDKCYLGPVIADGTLYLLTDDANLSAYR
ncbi:MAG: PQQ-binding-like beta-propeller repeat protein [Alphaproteobacteria bacterium]|nr:PQQ-binding-like beta-propeller repeat protein [Alphaproteobacteria bacterium]